MDIFLVSCSNILSRMHRVVGVVGFVSSCGQGHVFLFHLDEGQSIKHRSEEDLHKAQTHRDDWDVG